MLFVQWSKKQPLIIYVSIILLCLLFKQRSNIQLIMNVSVNHCLFNYQRVPVLLFQTNWSSDTTPIIALFIQINSGPIHRYIGNIDAFKIWYTYRYERPKLVKYRYGEKTMHMILHTSVTLSAGFERWQAITGWYILILTNSALPFIHTFLPICLLDKMEHEQECKFLEFRAPLTVKLFVWNTLYTRFMRKTK